MKIEESIIFFSALTLEEKKEFLARLSHELTILGRDAYEVGTENFTNPSQMRCINEIQHRIALQSLSLLKNEVSCYPDEIFVRMILEHPHNKMFEQKAVVAFRRIADKFLVAV